MLDKLPVEILSLVVWEVRTFLRPFTPSWSENARSMFLRDNS